ncbi:MAG TPA: rRNA maturation RNase YbeY [Candidatus Paceibacterota bacterium]|jgi:probable rRNA maturation factor|nr:rRNA maturation RNase YbeY [Candidatus Paceibacterota bacterium]
MRAQVSIKKTTRGPVPRLPFERMAKQILGSGYELSLVICGDSLAQRMNQTYRKKSYKPNVLSFPISKSEGEIFLNVQCAKREAKRYGTTFPKRLALLFIHGCFHLKGLKHGTKMEASEQKVLKNTA